MKTKHKTVIALTTSLVFLVSALAGAGTKHFHSKGKMP